MRQKPDETKRCLFRAISRGAKIGDGGQKVDLAREFRVAKKLRRSRDGNKRLEFVEVEECRNL